MLSMRARPDHAEGIVSDLSTAAKKAREWTLKRDALIRQQYDAGLSLRAIGEEAGLTHSAIAKIVAK